MLFSRRAGVLVGALLVVGCGPEASRRLSAVRTTSAALDSANGVSINGVSVNGVSVNGVSVNGVSINGVSVNGVSVNGAGLNGVSVNGVSVNGVSVNGVSVNGVSVNGVSVNGVSVNGTLLSGADFISAVLTGQLTDGSTVELRIDDATFGDDENDDVLMYTISVRLPESEWQPLCGTEASGARVKAIFLPGVWNFEQGVEGGGAWSPSDDAFTVACERSTIAKCLEMGYKPWREVRHQPVQQYLNACVRMIRADYCGNGRPWTVNGRQIDLWDGLNIQRRSERWNFEAEWTPDGARCVEDQRVIFANGDEPECLPYTIPRCGNRSHFNDGTKLMNQFQVQLVY